MIYVALKIKNTMNEFINFNDIYKIVLQGSSEWYVIENKRLEITSFWYSK